MPLSSQAGVPSLWQSYFRNLFGPATLSHRRLHLHSKLYTLWYSVLLSSQASRSSPPGLPILPQGTFAISLGQFAALQQLIPAAAEHSHLSTQPLAFRPPFLIAFSIDLDSNPFLGLFLLLSLFIPLCHGVATDCRHRRLNTQRIPPCSARLSLLCRQRGAQRKHAPSNSSNPSNPLESPFGRVAPSDARTSSLSPRPIRLPGSLSACAVLNWSTYAKTSAFSLLALDSRSIAARQFTTKYGLCACGIPVPCPALFLSATPAADHRILPRALLAALQHSPPRLNPVCGLWSGRTIDASSPI